MSKSLGLLSLIIGIGGIIVGCLDLTKGLWLLAGVIFTIGILNIIMFMFTALSKEE